MVDLFCALLRHLFGASFFASLLSFSADYPWLTAYLQLEITETNIAVQQPLLHKRLKALSQYGFSISIDDFGTGYSSLAYLTKLPIDEVKLDRSLITDLSSDLQSQGMVRNIIRMAHDLNLVVTAEGIETQEQQQLLNAMDCDLIQGYYYSKPLTEKDFITILRQQPFAGGLSNAH